MLNGLVITLDTIEEHKMHSETYSISEDAARRLNDAKKSGIESADDFGKYIDKAKKLVKFKS